MLAWAPEPQKPLVRDVLLRDGSSLRLQAPTTVDYEDIKAFYDGLSQRSHYSRFHGLGRTDIAARADAEASGVDRLALIARHVRPRGGGRLLRRVARAWGRRGRVRSG